MSKINLKGNVLKVVELGLQEKVLNEMKNAGFSVESLTRKLNGEGINITAQSIRKFIKKSKDARREIVSQDVRFSNELVKTAMDYNKELKNILKEVEEVKNDAKTEKDFTTYNQLIGRLLQGIELFAKLTGDLKPKGATDITVIYNQINSDIEKEMKGTVSTFKNITPIDIDAEILEEDSYETAKNA